MSQQQPIAIFNGPKGQKQKALEINLNAHIYGTFAEIGAGQEVARHFFQAGGAAGTIAKSISAYDMTMSDAIYGKEPSGRYVCQNRLETMMDIEYDTLLQRLSNVRPQETTFFAYADTVAAKSFSGVGENHGWLGIKFQHKSQAAPSSLILHVRMLDAENIQQQEALGLLGVNLIYAVFFNRHNREDFVGSLMDGLSSARLQIDMIKAHGDAFDADMDSRLLCLELVKRKWCEAIIFAASGEVLQANEVLYKKNILVVRGGYRPPTNLSLDMLQSGLKAFKNDLDSSEHDKVVLLPEISMSQLLDRGTVDNADFLSRVDLLCALGQMVLISNSESYAELNAYFNRTSKKDIGYVMLSYTLEEILAVGANKNHSTFSMKELGGMLEPRSRIYIYPASNNPQSVIKNTSNLNIADHAKLMLDYLISHKLVKDIVDYNPQVIHIWSRKVLEMIQVGDLEWEKLVPTSVAKTVKEKCLFGAKCDR